MQSNPRDVEGIKVLGARTFVTLVGHDMTSFSHPDFLRHLTGGILWAGGWDGTTGLGRGSQGGAQATRDAAAVQGAGPQVYRGRDRMVLENRRGDGRFTEARRFSPK